MSGRINSQKKSDKEFLIEEGGKHSGEVHSDDVDDFTPSPDTSQPSLLTANLGGTMARFPPQQTGRFSWIRSRMFWCSALVVILLSTIIILASSLRKLKSTEYGLEYNVHNKKLDEAARTGGLHIGPPGFRFVKFPSTQITVDLPDDTCLSQDGLRVQFSVTFQYQIKEESLLPVIRKYRDFERWSKFVEAAGNSAVQHACSFFTISNFQNKRGEIQVTMQDYLKLKLEGTPGGDGNDGVYATALSLQLRNVNLPEAYQAAVAEKQAASEDIILAQNQRVQETTKAQTTLLSAKEEVKIINNTAVNEADILLTEARIEAQAILHAFETESMAIVQAKTKLNLTSDGVLAYMTNKLYEKAANLTVSAGEPARLSRKELL